MLRLMMVERDREQHWGCSSSAEGGAGAAGRAAAAVKAGKCLFCNKQRRMQGDSDIDGIARCNHL